MAKVFISYTDNDHQYIEKIKASLQGRKVVGEWEPVETSSQDTMLTTIQRRLEAADVVLIFLSKQALASSGVMFELGAAQALGKKILPIILPDIDLDQLDFIDKDRTVLDARTLSLAETAKQIEELMRADSSA